MKALVFGVQPQPVDVAEGTPPLLANLARTPMELIEVPDAHPLLPDWVVTKPRLVGICGSDSKQALLDFGDESAENSMAAMCSFPQVMGHEVVADVVELGPEARGLEVGQRVVLNPWLSCAPRGVTPLCASCQEGNLSLCHNFLTGPISPGIHTGVSADATGGYAELMPAHTSMLFPVPDGLSDEDAILADPFAVSLHAVTRHPPRPGGKAMIYGAGSLGTTALSVLRLLYPDTEVAVVARFDAQAALARRMGASIVVGSDDRRAIIEELAQWSGGKLVPGPQALPMAHPGGIDVVYDTVGKPETFEVGVRLLAARGTLVKAGVHGGGRWEWSPLYFKEISWVGSNAFGIEEVEGSRRHGIEHYLDLAAGGRVDLEGMLTHTYRLEEWRKALTTIATQGETGAIKVAIDHR